MLKSVKELAEDLNCSKQLIYKNLQLPVFNETYVMIGKNNYRIKEEKYINVANQYFRRITNEKIS